ncbi:hypothetical protein BHE74_00036408 [Ensete ventricosum]|nr:hypothetical protein BHE74_00036408 [Ensete ventricosum]
MEGFRFGQRIPSANWSSGRDERDEVLRRMVSSSHLNHHRSRRHLATTIFPVLLFFFSSNNVLYPKEDREQRILLFACRNCDYQVASEGSGQESTHDLGLCVGHRRSTRVHPHRLSRDLQYFVSTSYLSLGIAFLDVPLPQEVADDCIVYRMEINQSVGERSRVLQDAAADPALPHTRNVRCANCNHPEAVFFQVRYLIVSWLLCRHHQRGRWAWHCSSFAATQTAGIGGEIDEVETNLRLLLVLTQLQIG